MFGVTTAAIESKLKDHDSPGANFSQDKVAQECESVDEKSETSSNSSDEEGTIPKDVIFDENDVEESSYKNVPIELSRDEE